MKKFTLIFCLVLAQVSAFAQISPIKQDFPLPSVLSESSGAIFFNNKLISLNDSGNQNKLYEVDTLSAEVTRIVTIDNAANVDWEDLTQDETSIYVGDIGNNSGNRTDLKIYKIKKEDFLNSTNVNAEIISFSYSDQTDFKPNPNKTDWDSEALVALDSELILFTKNWVNGTTKAYSIPKNSGTYSVKPLPTTLKSGGMITGATYNGETGKIYLVGYNMTLQPFLWTVENYVGSDVFSGKNTPISLASLGLEQVEAIAHVGANKYFMTSESFKIPPFAKNSKLFSFTTKDSKLAAKQPVVAEVNIYPNPVQEVINITGKDYKSLEIYDATGKFLLKDQNRSVNISHLNKGLFYVKIQLAADRFQVKKIIKM
jgi:hypothetical protein